LGAFKGGSGVFAVIGPISEVVFGELIPVSAFILPVAIVRTIKGGEIV
jgi:hypothetical protein